MRLTLLLSDAAQEAMGKVHTLGLGWNVTATPTPPMAVVVLLDVGWDETNKNIDLLLELVDADGHPVTVAGPFGDQPLNIAAQTQAGRPPGIPAGSEVRIPLTVNIGPGLPLISGQRYEWRATLDGSTNPDWSQSFFVR